MTLCDIQYTQYCNDYGASEPTMDIERLSSESGIMAVQSKGSSNTTTFRPEFAGANWSIDPTGGRRPRSEITLRSGSGKG